MELRQNYINQLYLERQGLSDTKNDLMVELITVENNIQKSTTDKTIKENKRGGKIAGIIIFAIIGIGLLSYHLLAVLSIFCFIGLLTNISGLICLNVDISSLNDTINKYNETKTSLESRISYLNNEIKNKENEIHSVIFEVKDKDQ